MPIIRVIDFDQELVRFHQVSFLDIDLSNVAVDPRKQIDHLVGDDIGSIGESNVEVLFQRCHGGNSDDTGFTSVCLGAAAEAKHNERCDREKNDYSKRDNRMLF